MTNEKPIAWLALKEGTTVRAADGEEVGKVTEVVADRAKDIFSGVNFRDGLFGNARFAPAEKIGAMTEDEVSLTITSGEVEALEEV